MREHRSRYRLILSSCTAALAVTAGLLIATSPGAAAQTLRLAPGTVSAEAAASPQLLAGEIVQQARILHLKHLAHLSHLKHLAWLAQQAELARQAAAAARTAASAPVRIVTVSHPLIQSAPAHYSGSTSMQQCIIAAESGGDPYVWNYSGHWGLYQFSYSTWVHYGGDPSLFGSAGPAYQTQIFWNAVAKNGYNDWTPYDSC